MRSTQLKQVSQMDVQIGKMHRELAKLYEERARMMQNVPQVKEVRTFKSAASEIDFPDEIIEELVNEEKPRKKAKKAKNL